jgi:hypothetical protein
MRLTGRPPSGAPVAAIERLSGVSIPAGPARVIVGHLSQGSLAFLAVLGARRLSPRPSTAAKLGLGPVAADASLGIAIHGGPPP